MMKAPRERTIKQWRLDSREKAIEGGTFRTTVWAEVYCIETQDTMRVNGMHTSTVLCKLFDAGKNPKVYVTFEKYEADTLLDVANLYSTFDTRDQSRSVGDVNSAHAASIPELASLNMNVMNNIVAGMAMATWGTHYTRCAEPQERAALLAAHTDFVTWCEGTVFDGGAKAKWRHLYRAAVIAAMFMTWNKDPDDATEFWLAVRDKTGESPDLPDRVLAEWLTITAVNYAAGAKRKKRATNAEFLAKCIHGWNAWRRNTSTNLKYHADKPTPDVV
jgi:hypothetical protein